MKEDIFYLTENHIKLLKRMHVYWDDAGYLGAPAIDLKRPYGDSCVLSDIWEIITGVDVECSCGDQKTLTEDEKNICIKLHKEMDSALQIVLQTGAFKIGKYEWMSYSVGWKFIEEDELNKFEVL
jgi:hypothetical protein